MRSFPSAPPGCGELNQFLTEKYRNERLEREAAEKAKREAAAAQAEKPPIKGWLSEALSESLALVEPTFIRIPRTPTEIALAYGDFERLRALSQRRAK